MFIGRERELKSLEMVYSKDGFGMTIIYGRRRVGKSTLITEFIKGKKAVFYTATKVGAERNLELFSKQVLSLLDPEYIDAAFSSIESILDILTKKVASTEEKAICYDVTGGWQNICHYLIHQKVLMIISSAFF